ncbi:hypothetical protein A9W97_17405 [Mycobacterium gordonae]|nr:hypothetical protein [Mycobacterium gordonae]OBJ87751.1 hypothetical protein A9W97_17405 [Mycobacterium gordonae]
MTGVRLLDHWSPPDGAGQPVACIATTFTFESDFFTQDCLSRFLSLSATTAEGDAISSIAAVLEEEDRLSEAQVSVLVDRSTPAEKRNLRWDLLPVGAPGGLLHAKVAALLWERSARIILGSANLTSAGYRRQVELALPIDLDDGCQMPRAVLDELVRELRRLVDLVAGPPTGPKGRALATMDQLAARVDSLHLPRASGSKVFVAVAPSRPGTSPLDRLNDVWRGGQPLRATLLSPFWDEAAPSPAVEAIRRRLTGRPASSRRMTFVVAVDPFTGTVHAPPSLANQSGATVTTFDPPDPELRALHAKLLLVESEDWLAALIGSSNATEAGLGLHAYNGHQELNLWMGCPAGSKAAKHLRALARLGERINLDDTRWEPVPDEDEPTTPVLPLGFVQCTVDAGRPPRVHLEFSSKSLPTSWQVRSPAGQELASADGWRAAGSSRSMIADLDGEALPSYLFVQWMVDGEKLEATWTVNVADRGRLPPPAELAELKFDVLLAALASTRPLPVALELELRRRQRAADEGLHIELDPLHRFDDSGLLLQRARHFSLALWRLQERLGRPATNIDAVHWRLEGALGPIAIADGLVQAAQMRETLPGEAHFLLAELALTVAAVDWSCVANSVDIEQVRTLVAQALSAIEDRRSTLPPAPDPTLDNYIRDALKAARR